MDDLVETLTEAEHHERLWRLMLALDATVRRGGGKRHPPRHTVDLRCLAECGNVNLGAYVDDRSLTTAVE